MLEDSPLEQIHSTRVRIKEGSNDSIFEIVSNAGEVAPVDQIPLSQLAKLEEIAASFLTGKHT